MRGTSSGKRLHKIYSLPTFVMACDNSPGSQLTMTLGYMYYEMCMWQSDAHEGDQGQD